MDDFDYDDFGKHNGKRFFENGFVAQKLVQRWHPLALGNRPQDWATRDLILGNMRADRRNWAFRELVKNNHPKFLENMRGIPSAHRKQITVSRACLFFHYLSLLNLKNCSDEKTREVANRMLGCCPNLFLVDGQKSKTPLRNCRQCHYCPFCLGRNALHVYKSVRSSDSASNYIYVLASVTHDLYSLFDYDNNCLPLERKRLSANLREFAIGLNAISGVFTFQVAPKLTDVPKFDDDALVGTEELAGFTVRGAVMFKCPVEVFSSMNNLDLAEVASVLELSMLLEIGESAQIVIEADRGRDIFRSLIYGEAPGSLNAPNQNGHQGVFSYQQWHLATVWQWQEFIAASRGIKQYSFWGEWKSTRVRSPRNQLINAPNRRGEFRRRTALSVANHQRHIDAEITASGIIEQIRPYIEAFYQVNHRWPGRLAIQEFADEIEISISQRMARRVANRIQTFNEE